MGLDAASVLLHANRSSIKQQALHFASASCNNNLCARSHLQQATSYVLAAHMTKQQWGI
jgi:hypothetical protein